MQEAGYENKISYKFKVGRATEEIVKEIKEVIMIYWS
jgi:hypothetical protein